MTNETLREEYSELVPEEFLDCEVIYEGEWSSYEEHGWIVVFNFFGELFSMSYEYSVMSSDNEFYFDPSPITQADLTGIHQEWLQIEKEYGDLE